MKSNTNNSLILMTFFGFIGSILLGVIVYGHRIFDYPSPTFLFIVYGLFGALFFAFLEYKPVKVQVYVIIILFIVDLFSYGKYPETSDLLKTVFYLGSLLLSVRFYHGVLKRYPSLIYYLRSIILAAIYGAINVLSGSLFFMIHTGNIWPPQQYIVFLAALGFFIGLGMGIGIDFFLQQKAGIFKIFKIS